MEFEEACSEMNFIIQHMYPLDRKMIPKTVQNFFKDNCSYIYRVKLTTDKPLKEQNLKDVTKVFIQVIYNKYFSNNVEEQQDKIILEQQEELSSSNEENKMVEYKERKIITFIKSLWKKFVSKFK